ncbi:MAG TPA: hypothetical protein PK443_00320 [bacterium]|nr:hypothetical protein [bacterium]
MKKVLVLASLSLLALSFGCGGSGEKAENKETGAAMSQAVMVATSQSGFNLIGGVASINETGSEEPIDCPLYGTITPSYAVDGTSMTVKYEECGAGLPACPGHVFMNGTLEESWEIDGTNYTSSIGGTIDFIDAPDSNTPDVYFVGQKCVFDISITLNYQTLVDYWLAEDYDGFIEYATSGITGDICGYDWKELSELTDEEICLVIENKE